MEKMSTTLVDAQQRLVQGMIAQEQDASESVFTVNH
jgi:hypothetical protein